MSEELDSVKRRYKDNSINTVNLSRYKNTWRIIDEEGDFYQESADPIKIERSSSDKLHKVVPGEENRLDLISYNYYGSPLYWWVIAEASGLYNPMDVPVDTVLIIPARSRLFTTNGVLSL